MFVTGSILFEHGKQLASFAFHGRGHAFVCFIPTRPPVVVKMMSGRFLAQAGINSKNAGKSFCLLKFSLPFSQLCQRKFVILLAVRKEGEKRIDLDALVFSSQTA
ncbi:hypothetical protein ACMGGR_20510 [Erwinia sp. BNK-24-b]|uniref:hypothetical protein n=1 Tax=unclassified Erwinia TaxID=2622719 RepID=UPI0039BF8F8F